MEPSTSDIDPPRFRPHPSEFKVKSVKYATSLDSRGYMPVYEYILDGPCASAQPIMWDRETGEVHFTSIWKLIGLSKADIVKVIDSNPELQAKKIRGGFLKIQGTWIPYDHARVLAIRTCYAIRHGLVPLFGSEFPSECLHPSQPGFGCLLLKPSMPTNGHRVGKRRRSPYARTLCMQRNNIALFRPPLSSWIEDNSRAQRRRKPHLPPPLHTTQLPPLQLPSLPQPKSPYPAHRLTSPILSPPGAKKHKPTSPRGMEFLLNDSDDYKTPEPTRSWGPASPSSRGSHTSHSSADGPMSRSLITPSPSPPHKPITISHPLVCRSRPAVMFVPAERSQVSQPLAGEGERDIPKDIADTMTATVLLQRLSQDDGRRPFRPSHETSLPRMVTFGGRDYSVVWTE
ncbi:uncharacterized protein VTP21DRAFT_2726 [Calcarisporiella thermophila]|uniref:uncharacterized protein n=1 Tax=Calcarisporiella thermophila TaxID=911321 RepID=UPI0037438053